MCWLMGARLVWASSNFIVFVCMAGTAIISLVSIRQYSEGILHIIGANGSTKIASLLVFALLGLPLAMIMSLGAGPWDALFGGGNIPAFVLASFCALAWCYCNSQAPNSFKEFL